MGQTDCIYGDTGSTKTSRLGDAAEYFFEKTNKPARLVSSDTGGWAVLDSLVENGIVIPFQLTFQRGNTLIEDMDKLSQGWWPADPKDPQSKLLPPADLKEKCGLLMIDGWTSWCQMMMTFHEGAITFDQRTQTVTATNVKVPEMPKDSFVQSGSYVRRFTGRSDYGGVQARVKEFIRNSAMLPVQCISTALETKGSDEQKKPVYGPDFIGQALTGVSGPWFGNLLRLGIKEAKTKVNDVDVVEAKPILYTRRHIDGNDPLKIPYMAKVRVDRRLWDKVPSVMEPDLKKFYALLDALALEARKLAPVVMAKAG